MIRKVAGVCWTKYVLLVTALLTPDAKERGCTLRPLLAEPRYHSSCFSGDSDGETV